MSALPDARRADLLAWLTTLPAALELRLDTLRPASSDASFRRYFRLDAGDGTLVVMDAPPEREDSRPFVAMVQRLAGSGLHVPQILADDLAQGFLLLTDLGEQNFYDYLQTGPSPAAVQALYRDVLPTLVRWQQVPATGLARLDGARLLDELQLFPEWYLGRHLGVTLTEAEQQALQRIFAALAARAEAEPVVLVHRDFHSPNLMLPQASAPHQPGIIDFQDALAGPLSYDIASLVMDARTTWDESQQLDWGIRYWEAARTAGLPVPHDIADFHADWEWMGLQRNLRILGVFARLNHRDGKAHYLAHMPRVLEYVRQVAYHADVFLPLLRLLDRAEAA